MSAVLATITSGQTRMESLISWGYFPEELPPPFTTKLLGQSASEIISSLDKKDVIQFWSTPENYSIPRYGHARRKLSIVNPINQLYVSYLIAENWLEIKKSLERSSITEFSPEIIAAPGKRAVNGVDFEGVSRRAAAILGSYGRYVKTDIARFYASIYTHSIPWALLGKDHCKINHNKPLFKASFANQLDKAVASGQAGQTIGLPIGPDTSRILSELIATEIERIARVHIADLDERSARYVDDMLIGLYETETPSAVLFGLSAALSEYGLEINAEKTVTLGMGSSHAPEWVHYFKNFKLRDKKPKQHQEIDSFFEQAFYLYDKNPRDNVMRYAVKRAINFGLLPDDFAHLVRWLLYAARRCPSCLRLVAEHLAASNTTDGMPAEEVERYILQQLPLRADASDIEEVCWLLFWAREIGLIIPADVIQKIARLRSSVAALICLELQQLGQISGSADFTYWQSFACEEGLASEMWLVAYEATKKGWWPIAQSSSFITEHKLFNELYKRDVEFYDKGIKARKFSTTPFIKAANDEDTALLIGKDDTWYD